MAQEPRRDALTRLRGRASLVASLRALDAPALLVLADLQGLRAHNARFGLASGDARLRSTAERLADLLGPRRVHRTGDDEFAWLVSPVPHDPGAYVQEVLQAWHTAAADSGLRLGWVVAEPGDEGGVSLARAAVAVGAAKQNSHGISGFTDFDASRMDRRDVVARALRQALATRDAQLHLAYQPIVRLADGAVVAVEALARWEHPTLGVIGPDEFVTVAEQTGQAGALDLWVVTRALAELSAHRGSPLVHVNVSAASLTSDGFVSDLLDRVGASGAAPERLCVELTETALAGDRARLRHAVETLHAEGLRLSIDDFGTGHASWAYLNTLPVDEVKLDRSYVEGIDVDVRRAAVVRAVVEVARACGQSVVAEGIETPEQAQALLEIGCPLGQGYLLGRPQRPDPRAATAAEVAVPVRAARQVRVPARRPEVVEPVEADGAQHLSDLARELSSVAPDPAVLFRLAVGALRRTVDFTGGSLQLAGPDGVRLAAADPPPPPEAFLARLPLGQGVAGAVLATGRPVYLPDITRSAAVPARKRAISGGVRSYLAMPLFSAGRPVGVLQIDSTFVDAFTTQDRLELAATAALVAAALGPEAADGGAPGHAAAAAVVPGPRREGVAAG